MEQQDQIPKPLQQPQQPPRKCPRCDSDNTKFCYYNNYSMSQPRYLCKACRRYWTQGGILRNIPVGSHSRKGKRPKKSSSSSYLSKSSSPSLSSHAPSVTVPSLHVNEEAFLTTGSHLSSFLKNDHQPLYYSSDLVTTLPSSQSFNQMGASDPSNVTLFQDYIRYGFNPPSHAHDSRRFDLKGTADKYQTRWEQSFINGMTMKNTGPGSTSSGNPDTNINNCVVWSPYLDQDQWSGHQNLPGP